ncbi:MAG: right-handed parallel beta-helix repeat-containing protein [Nitrososphaerota archaeon]|nr:right-handed parallel beta-helix repeat-containing protein [Nitrososphaerota archaeon]
MLLVSPLLPKIATAQPSQGNWVVTGTQVVQNESITLNGNLTVMDGGNLTLRQTTLRMNLESDGQFGIEVEPGGSLYVFGSTIVSSNAAYRYTFTANGSALVIKNTTIENAGWCHDPSLYQCAFTNGNPAHAGVTVMSDHAVIEDDTFSNGSIGLMLTGSGDVVNGDRIEQNTFSALVMAGANRAMVANNTFLQAPQNSESDDLLLSESQNNTIVDNTIGTKGPETGNSQGPTDGIKAFRGSSGNMIAHNIIAARARGVAIFESDRVEVVDNSITFNEFGVGAQSSPNFHVIGNTLKGFPQSGSEGIFLDLSNNSVVANNTLSGVKEGINLDHTGNTNIVDNVVTTDCFPGGTCTDPEFFDLWLNHSSNNTIAGDSFSGTAYGGLLTSSSKLDILYDNAINASHSVTIIDSNLNQLFQNDFYDRQGNSGGPYDNGANSWHKENAGNYWSYFGCNEGGCGQYNRDVIPPSGQEPISLPEPVQLASYPISLPPLVPPPSLGSAPNQQSTTLEHQTVSLGAGCMPGNVTIVDSTVVLGAEGPASIGGCGQQGPVLIANSRLIGVGYGFSIGAEGIGTSFPLTIKNSTIDGAYMQDVAAPNILIENSTITNSQTAWGITVQNAQNVTIVDSTFVDEFQAIGFYCGNSVSGVIFLKGNTIRDSLSVAISTCGTTPQVTIDDNVITGSWGDGIDGSCSVTASGVCSIVGNKVENVLGLGLSLFANSSMIANNTVTNAEFGIAINGDYNMITGNTIVNATSDISIYGVGNTEYNNSFMPVPTTTNITTTTTTSSNSATSSASLSTPTSSTSSTSSSGGIPEFPFQALVVGVFTSLVVVSYLATRRKPAFR